MVLSDALSEFLGGETELARTEVVKRLHQYIKDHNLQNPKDRRKIMFDDKLKDLFKCQSTTYFKINK
jgi:upstream activation factor subunit UAF30